MQYICYFANLIDGALALHNRMGLRDKPLWRLPPPDPLSTILMYLGAVVMALDAALAPGSTIAAAAPPLAMGGIWSFLPILLMSVAATIWIVRGLVAHRRSRQ